MKARLAADGAEPVVSTRPSSPPGSSPRSRNGSALASGEHPAGRVGGLYTDSIDTRHMFPTPVTAPSARLRGEAATDVLQAQSGEGCSFPLTQQSLLNDFMPSPASGEKAQ